jgi:hypothetical protein
MPDNSLARQYRNRTARGMGLAGNHWDAIQKHLDAYEAAVAHELAERVRDAVQGDDPDYAGTRGAVWAADLIDPEAPAPVAEAPEPKAACCGICQHTHHGTAQCDGGSVSTITGCHCTGRAEDYRR